MRSGSATGGGLRLEDVLALTGQLEVRPLLEQILQVSTSIPGAADAALYLLGADGTPVETIGTAREDETAAASALIRFGDQASARLGVWSDDAGPLPETSMETLAELAQVAEVAVGNARAYAASERRRDWVHATAELAETLHPPVRLEETMAAIAAGVRRVARASFAAVLVPNDHGGFDVPAVDGTHPARAELIDSLHEELAEASEDGHLVCVAHGTGTTAVLPVAAERTPGLLVLLVHERGRGRLIASVRELLVSFADQAALAVDRASVLQERQAAVVRMERERIGRDLHDAVIQRLFATGMRLQSIRHSEDLADAQGSVDEAVEELELTIRHIRSTIFELQHGHEASMRAEVGKLGREFAPALGFDPQVHVWGPVDSLVAPELADQATLVLREALSNVARHAGAGRCTVEVSVDAGVLRLRVEDDGRGLGPESEIVESGLSNLRRRAESLGGSFAVEAAEPRGTRLTWRVPLSS